MGKKQINEKLCQNKCANEFASCMQMALDTFAMGACYDAEQNCESQCIIPSKKKSRSFMCWLGFCNSKNNKKIN